MRLTQNEFKLISSLVRDYFGINLDEHKKTLVYARLHKILTEGGFRTFKDYYDYVVNDKTGQALSVMVDRLSTNHTYFFREKDHFDYFKETVLPKIADGLRQSQRNDIRIWCAGCSTGEEAYTIAMLVREYFQDELRLIDTAILATDISSAVLQKATDGLYTEEQISKLPRSYIQNYFVSLGEGVWEVRKELKRLLFFRRFNLIRAKYPFKRQFQTIFCRNVMIYFNNPTRHLVIEKFYQHLDEDGSLFVGHSENVDRTNGMFQYIRPAVYQKLG